MTKTNGACTKAEFIKTYFIDTFPECRELFEKVPTVEPCAPTQQSTPSAVVETVIMQMLSGKAAGTIYSRVKNQAGEKKFKDWELCVEDYRKSGLSKTKAETIIRFAEYYRENNG